MTSPADAARQRKRAARRLADKTNSRINAAAGPAARLATVATVTAGAASDGNAVVDVTYRGATTTASSYSAAYTPVVGHRVLCLLLEDGQLVILGRQIGAP